MAKRPGKGPGYGDNIWENRISALEAEVKKLRDEKAPTFPFYDPAAFPTNSVPGQIALALPSSASPMTAYGYDEVDGWWPIGTGPAQLFSKWCVVAGQVDHSVLTSHGSPGSTATYTSFTTKSSTGSDALINDGDNTLTEKGLYVITATVVLADTSTLGDHPFIGVGLDVGGEAGPPEANSPDIMTLYYDTAASKVLGRITVTSVQKCLATAEITLSLTNYDTVSHGGADPLGIEYWLEIGMSPMA